MDGGDVVGYAWVSLCAVNGVAFAFSFGTCYGLGALLYLVAMGWHMVLLERQHSICRLAL